MTNLKKIEKEELVISKGVPKNRFNLTENDED